jgi:hypothetical protein
MSRPASFASKIESIGILLFTAIQRYEIFVSDGTAIPRLSVDDMAKKEVALWTTSLRFGSYLLSHLV